MTVTQARLVQPQNELAAALSTAPQEAENKVSNGGLAHQNKTKNTVNFSNATPSTSSTKSTTEPQTNQSADQVILTEILF